ncbi:cotranscriptional regulator ARB2A homolog isoform X2 [Amia ocellicauda]|uniref:cotranscriptional regulator ARB2A homolog isoform X2 n=1 Tax=Amia ocellicauda TaxID=2972642 RepID=UPI003464152E
MARATLPLDPGSKMDGFAEISGDPSCDFQYYFNQQGQLRHRVSEEAFVFRYIKGDVKGNQQQLLALEQYVTKHIYTLLEEECHLNKIYIPVDASDRHLSAFFFMSPGALDQNGLVILIQDQGTIRAGQWSRRMIVQEDVEKGTQIPYIHKVLEDSCGIIVMNPNDNSVELQHNFVENEDVANQQRFLMSKSGSSTPEEHVRYVWDFFVSKCAATHIAVVTHGYGGLAFVDLLSHRSQEVQNKVYAVAFIDSFHNLWHQVLDKDSQEWLKKHCRKWVLSSKPLDRPISFLKVDCPQVSAGTESHDAAPWMCLRSIFRFFAKTMKAHTTIPFTRAAIITRSKSRNRLTQSRTASERPAAC